MNDKTSLVHQKWVQHKKVKSDVYWQNRVPRGEDYLYKNFSTERDRHEKVHRVNFELIEPRVKVPDISVKKPHQDIR